MDSWDITYLVVGLAERTNRKKKEQVLRSPGWLLCRALRVKNFTEGTVHRLPYFRGCRNNVVYDNIRRMSRQQCHEYAGVSV